MQKALVALLVGLLFVPSFAFAQYHSDPQINSLISLLIEQVKVLQAQLVALQEKVEDQDDEPTYEELVAYRDRLSGERLRAFDAWNEGNCEREYSPSSIAYSNQKKHCDPIQKTIKDSTADLITVNKKLEVMRPMKLD